MRESDHIEFPAEFLEIIEPAGIPGIEGIVQVDNDFRRRIHFLRRIVTGIVELDITLAAGICPTISVPGNLTGIPEHAAPGFIADLDPFHIDSRRLQGLEHFGRMVGDFRRQGRLRLGFRTTAGTGVASILRLVRATAGEQQRRKDQQGEYFVTKLHGYKFHGLFLQIIQI